MGGRVGGRRGQSCKGRAAVGLILLAYVSGLAESAMTLGGNDWERNHLGSSGKRLVLEMTPRSPEVEWMPGGAGE